MNSGAYTLTADDISKQAAFIATGFTSSITSLVVQVTRGGQIQSADLFAIPSGTRIILTGGGNFTPEAGDVVNWIASGN
jgi:hypothetical protein